MKWMMAIISIVIFFAACKKEDDLQQQTNTGNNNTSPVKLSELVFYSDSAFSPSGADSVAYRIVYSGSNISKMIKLRQHPATGGVNIYEDNADSIQFSYNASGLILRSVFKNGLLKKSNQYSFTAGQLMLEQEQGYSPSYTGTRTPYYFSGNRNHDYGVFSNNFKDSTFYMYNSNNDMNSCFGLYNYGTGWSQYGYTLTYTSQTNALRTLINNDVLLSVMLGGDPGVKPSAFVPDSLNMAYGGAVYFKRKVVQQIHSSGYIQRMINYFHRPFMRFANVADKLPYVELKYDNL